MNDIEKEVELTKLDVKIGKTVDSGQRDINRLIDQYNRHRITGISAIINTTLLFIILTYFGNVWWFRYLGLCYPFTLGIIRVFVRKIYLPIKKTKFI